MKKIIYTAMMLGFALNASAMTDVYPVKGVVYSSEQQAHLAGMNAEFAQQIAQRRTLQHRNAQEDNGLAQVAPQQTRAWRWFDYINPVAWIKWMLGY